MNINDINNFISCFDNIKCLSEGVNKEIFFIDKEKKVIKFKNKNNSERPATFSDINLLFTEIMSSPNVGVQDKKKLLQEYKKIKLDFESKQNSIISRLYYLIYPSVKKSRDTLSSPFDQAVIDKFNENISRSESNVRQAKLIIIEAENILKKDEITQEELTETNNKLIDAEEKLLNTPELVGNYKINKDLNAIKYKLSKYQCIMNLDEAEKEINSFFNHLQSTEQEISDLDKAIELIGHAGRLYKSLPPDAKKKVTLLQKRLEEGRVIKGAIDDFSGNICAIFSHIKEAKETLDIFSCKEESLEQLKLAEENLAIIRKSKLNISYELKQLDEVKEAINKLNPLEDILLVKEIHDILETPFNDPLEQKEAVQKCIQFLKLKSMSGYDVWNHLCGLNLEEEEKINLRSKEKLFSFQQMDQIIGNLLEYASPNQGKQLINIHHSLIENLKTNPSEVDSIPDLEKQFSMKFLAQTFKRKLKNQKRRGEIITELNLGVGYQKNIDEQKGMLVAAQLNQNIEKETVKICSFSREPLENLEKKENLMMSSPEIRFSRFISFERFQSSLRNTFTQTLKEILKSPEDERDYVILADEADKSTNWVAAQVLDIAHSHPPKAIVNRNNLISYLKNHPNIKHLIMIDDGAYSGEQAARYIAELPGIEGDKTFHINIPYMTSYAKKRIEDSFKGYHENVHYHFPKGQIMMTYKELDQAGFFGYEKMNRPDIKKLIEIAPIKLKDELTLQNQQLANRWIVGFEKMRKTIFQMPDKPISIDEHIRNRLDSFIEEFEEIKGFIVADEKVLEDLKSVKTGIERFGINEIEREVQRNRYVKQVGQVNFESRTGTWMAHKSADHVSTDDGSMEQAMKSLRSAIEPYKSNKNQAREEQIQRLQQKSPHFVQQWHDLSVKLNISDIDDVRIVQSNRGLYLLGNNYSHSQLAPSNVEIESDKTGIIPFGGSNGAFQFKIEEGVPFTIKKGEVEARFELVNGNLILL